jgi:hypothetical protein
VLAITLWIVSLIVTISPLLIIVSNSEFDGKEVLIPVPDACRFTTPVVEEALPNPIPEDPADPKPEDPADPEEPEPEDPDEPEEPEPEDPDEPDELEKLEELNVLEVEEEETMAVLVGMEVICPSEVKVNVWS